MFIYFWQIRKAPTIFIAGRKQESNYIVKLGILVIPDLFAVITKIWRVFRAAYKQSGMEWNRMVLGCVVVLVAY